MSQSISGVAGAARGGAQGEPSRSPMTSRCFRFLPLIGSGTALSQISSPTPAGSTIGTGHSAGRSAVPVCWSRRT
ncbi:hypothetical protein ACWDKQ_10745 [Saccharopolyspora sp. NPDC000995]